MKNGIYVLLLSLIATASWAQTTFELKNKFLTQAGQQYYMHQGSIELFGQEECLLSIARMGSCFGANPAAPYIIPMFKPLNSNGFVEYVDPIYGAQLNKNLNPNGPLLASRFHESEVRVLIAKVPPRAAYMGYQTYVITREGQGADSYLDQFLPSTIIGDGHPSRFYVFNSVSNSVNNVVLSRSLGGDGHWSSGSFAVISSHDLNGINRVKSLLKKSGFKDKQIFVESLGKRLRPGLGKGADEYISLIRYALPEDASGRTYQSNPSKIYAYRLLPKVMSSLLRAEDEIIEAKGGVDESSFELLQKQILKQIDSALLKNSTKSRLFSVEPIGFDTFKCIDSSRNCLGDSRDTDTYRVSSQFELKDDEAIVLVGINHTVTGNATYISTNLFDRNYQRPIIMKDSANNQQEVTSISQVGRAARFNEALRKKELEGSAKRLMDGLGIRYSNFLSKRLKYYWALVLARDCSGIPLCYEVKTSGDLSADVDEDFGFMHRAYIVPGEQRGADPSLLLSPRYSHGLVK